MALVSSVHWFVCGGAWAQKSATRLFDLRIQDRKLLGGSTIRVSEGETVELRWSSDETVHLHLHGYDLEAEVAPGRSAVLGFEAGITGRFPIEIHGFGDGDHEEKTLLYIEVYPD